MIGYNDESTPDQYQEYADRVLEEVYRLADEAGKRMPGA
jgi:hypothetical protein